MELRVNDLLGINSVDDLIGDFIESPWVYEAVKRAPFVVVRRSPLINHMVPVGIRGNNRSERLAATLLYSNIIEIIRPEQLVEGKLWRNNEHISKTQMLKALEDLDIIFKSHNIVWGPTGSVGFELTSGVETVTASSDLDIIARTPEFLPINIAKDIIKKIFKIPIKIDIQLETSKGSVALAEYARGEGKVLLRTFNGPKLVENPWSEDE